MPEFEFLNSGVRPLDKDDLKEIYQITQYGNREKLKIGDQVKFWIKLPRIIRSLDSDNPGIRKLSQQICTQLMQYSELLDFTEVSAFFKTIREHITENEKLSELDEDSREEIIVNYIFAMRRIFKDYFDKFFQSLDHPKEEVRRTIMLSYSDLFYCYNEETEQPVVQFIKSILDLDPTLRYGKQRLSNDKFNEIRDQYSAALSRLFQP